MSNQNNDAQNSIGHCHQHETFDDWEPFGLNEVRFSSAGVIFILLCERKRFVDDNYP